MNDYGNIFKCRAKCSYQMFYKVPQPCPLLSPLEAYTLIISPPCTLLSYVFNFGKISLILKHSLAVLVSISWSPRLVLIPLLLGVVFKAQTYIKFFPFSYHFELIGKGGGLHWKNEWVLRIEVLILVKE